ncbi:MAG: TIM barrel protein [Acidobacteriota bacterium]|nr:TIM barrel protein [Acidobacteriota bacterium]
MPKFAASVAMMFNEWELLDRFEQAANMGFEGVEIQAPYAESAADIADRVRTHRLTAALMNVPVGAGAIPGQEDDFREGLRRAFDYAQAAGCGQLHCLAGRTDDSRAEATFVSNLKWGSEQARPLGIRLLLEPLNTQDNPGYFLTGSAQARRIIDLVAEDNVFLQYDFYHMQIMEGYLAETVRANIDIISHFQIGGVPGRHEPDDSQEINYPYLFDVVDDLGFEGWVGCEYRPAGETIAGLPWARPYGIAAR